MSETELKSLEFLPSQKFYALIVIELKVKYQRLVRFLPVKKKLNLLTDIDDPRERPLPIAPRALSRSIVDEKNEEAHDQNDYDYIQVYEPPFSFRFLEI